MKHKVSELEGALLDAAVAMAKGWQRMASMPGWTLQSSVLVSGEMIDTSTYHPQPLPWSADWAIGGPIIERERITFDEVPERSDIVARSRPVKHGHTLTSYTGSHPSSYLIAAMRAYVASKFGDEVDLP